jgi:hypothetical protein
MTDRVDAAGSPVSESRTSGAGCDLEVDSGKLLRGYPITSGKSMLADHRASRIKKEKFFEAEHRF